MKTKIVLFFEVALTVGFLTAASVQAVPTTYVYTGNPFTNVNPPYTTSDFVSGSVEFSSPLAANMSFTMVTPLAFSFSDGVQTITNTNATFTSFTFATGPSGEITIWNVDVDVASTGGFIRSVGGGSISPGDGVQSARPPPLTNSGVMSAGKWTTVAAQVPDTGSTLSLMTLTLMALGVAARQFKRAAA